MPVHSLATLFGDVSVDTLVVGALAFAAILGIRTWLGGRKCTWERDWAGKMILVVAPPSPTIITLIDQLLQLPSPPQILFLPPIPSPLPPDLLTVLHTIRLGVSKNPAAQLHCEPLPMTVEAVRDFTKKWGSAPAQMVGEAGRRVDAIVLGHGWEVELDPKILKQVRNESNSKSKSKEWNTHQFQFHLLTALLPSLLRAPAERDIRIVNLISPTWSAALPSLEGKNSRTDSVNLTGRRSINTLLLMKHFQLVLDTLEAVAQGKVKPVPASGKGKGTGPAEDATVKKRDKNVKSNILAISVIMGWARQEVIKGSLVSSALSRLLWIILYPLILVFTPSSRSIVQSILFALSAPVRKGTIDDTPRVAQDPSVSLDSIEQRRSGVAGGDVVRDCAVVDLPPVLSDPALAKAVYDQLEKEVEQGVKAAQEKKKATEGKAHQ
ncbi:hypothetical protein I316_03400 [Kwoniella heveanensis BCC8398]|uniref:Uncharacterized protein n=1 Tax=Kwoniella heveanensis BCC8398 TaxID=1296120 RepID=A0A1B9GUZ0_9TREE|nr:hypothetical protein I316_03400 [Kwoniella heveanensis BCC8398]